MNILFYVDPIIEKQDPCFKEGWVNIFTYDMIRTIKESKYRDNYKIYIVLNTTMSEMFKGKDYVDKIITVNQKELLNVFEWDYFDATKKWQNGSYSLEQLKAYKDLYRDKLDMFTPDIIITYSNVPFLKQLFPKSVIFHREYGIFSRKPFPETWYMDICGMNTLEYVNRYYSSIINNVNITTEVEDKLNNFKLNIQKKIHMASPFNEKMNYYKCKYDKLILLALGIDELYHFSSLTHYRNQFQLLMDVLNTVAPNVGVVVTKHPDYKLFNNNLIAYLRKEYPNFIYEDDFEKYYASSQYLIRYMDAIITTSPSLSIQSLLWDKKFITIDQRIGKCISDGIGVESIMEVLSSKAKNKNKLLLWLLTRYYYTKDYLYNAEWLNTFFNNAIYKKQNNLLDEFYELIDDESTLIDRIYNECDWHIPQENFRIYTEININKNNLIKSELKVIVNHEEDVLFDKIENSVKGKNIYIWGAGGHTNNLLEFLDRKGFDMNQIKGIIDGKLDSGKESIMNKKVYKYDCFVKDCLKECTDIIISSASFENEIFNDMDECIVDKCNIIKLYDYDARIKVLV